MNLSVIASRTRFGIESLPVRVEVHISAGMPRFHLVGLPEKAINESKERVRSAIINSGFVFPHRRVTINLSPADLPKESGGGLDLAIALGILEASNQIKIRNKNNYEFIGELALSGEILPVRGFILAAIAADSSQKSVIASRGNSVEASLLKNLKFYPADMLFEVAGHLNGVKELEMNDPKDSQLEHKEPPVLYLDDIKGQHRAKRALIIAAAGGHNMLMSGPPGSGKTILAQRLSFLLPKLTNEEYTEVLRVHSMTNKSYKSARINRLRPFRTPHHSATKAALAGGGSNPVPGEISLAHKGVLFLDELPEFSRSVLECLRQPLESGKIVISRATKHLSFPADFQMIAAMNPCPCGNLNHPIKECRCSPDKVLAYKSKISGPLLDRIDLLVEVPPISFAEGFAAAGGDSTGSSNQSQKDTSIKKQGEDAIAVHRMKHNNLCQDILAARKLQISRCKTLNSRLKMAQLEEEIAELDDASHKIMKHAVEKLGMSMRVIHRIIKVARTIADLENSDRISQTHLAEAISYRSFP